MPIQSAAAAGTTATPTATVPAAAVVGDQAFFAVASKPVPAADVTTGWSAFRFVPDGTSSTDAQLMVFTKRLVSGDIGSAVTATPAGALAFAWTAQVVTIPGLHTSAPITANLEATSLTSPSQFTSKTVVGGAGTATYVYTVTAIDAAGETIATITATVTSAPTTLTSSNYVHLVWSPVLRATNFNVYGRTSGSQTLIATVTNATTDAPGVFQNNNPGYDDKGVAPGIQVPPTQQPLGWLMDGRGNDPAGVPLTERLRSTYSGAQLLMFVMGHLFVSDTSSTVSDPGGVTGILTSRSTAGDLALHSATQTLGAPTDVGTRLFTPSGLAKKWATTGILLRPAGANGTPTARAGYGQVAETGALVYLDASDSYDDDGDTLTYSWAQTSGTTVVLSGAVSRFPTFTMPKGTVVFQLTVTDPSSATSIDTVTITNIAAGTVKVKNTVGIWTRV